MTEGIEFTNEQLFNMAYEAYLTELENEVDGYFDDNAKPIVEDDEWETAYKARLAALDEITAESQQLDLYK